MYVLILYQERKMEKWKTKMLKPETQERKIEKESPYSCSTPQNKLENIFFFYKINLKETHERVNFFFFKTPQNVQNNRA